MFTLSTGPARAGVTTLSRVPDQSVLLGVSRVSVLGFGDFTVGLADIVCEEPEIIVKGIGKSSRTGAGGLFLALVAVLLISLIVACSDSTPTKSLTFATPAPATESLAPAATAALTPTVTAALATTTQSPTVAPTAAPILPPSTAEPTATSE